MKKSISPDNDGGILDTADSGTVMLDRDLHVALVTPGCAPSVLRNEVGIVALLAVTDEQQVVVSLRTAIGIIVDTALVHLEGLLVCFDADEKGSNVECA